MTIPYFLELADYNIWANNQIISWVNELSQEQWDQEIISSFNSIKETCLHLVGAESIWGERLLKTEQSKWVPYSFQGDKAALLTLWKEASKNLQIFVTTFDDHYMNESLTFKRINGEVQTMKYYEILAHVFNHSTYHRGQLVTLLRQVGFTNVSSTDLLMYYRTQR